MNVPIEFSEDDMCAKLFPHTDALVIATNIQGVDVRRILDNGSSTDLLFASTFDKRGLSKTHLLSPEPAWFLRTGYRCPRTDRLAGC